MATVYEAVQLSLDRPVALKILAPELAADPDFTNRFMREARIVGRLAHASIVPVYEVGEQDGHYFIAMEYVTGGDLVDAMNAGLSEARTHSILTQVAQALGYAHGHNIVHRDIKPDNVLMRDPATAMVADFGIAREISTPDHNTSLTEVQTVIGSPHYMSPEQMRAEPLDQRTDIYSLGVVAWQLLTNELPHSGKTLSELSVAQATVGVPELPQGLAHWQPLMNGMLAYDRDARLSDCSHVLAQLAQLKSAGGTIIARQSGRYPAGATESRQRRSYLSTRAFVGSAVLLLLLAGALFGWLKIDEDPEISVSQPGVVNQTAVVTDSRAADFSGIAAKDSLLPIPVEYFAFRDLLAMPEIPERTRSAREYVKSYQGSVLSDILRVHVLNELAEVPDLRARANAGDVKSLMVMSELYANGWAVAKSPEKAEEFASIAAQSGAVFAQYQLATLLFARQRQVPGKVSPSISIPLERAVAADFYLAQTMLAGLEYVGRIADEPRPKRSVELLQRAAMQGDRNAMLNLSEIYKRDSDGIPVDLELSKHYFSQALELGQPEAVARSDSDT